jgi:ferritin-like metal-binding protein YciE
MSQETDSVTESMQEELVRFLKDAHAMEQQSLQTLQAAVAAAGDPQLQSLYQGHVVETQRHLELLKERLEVYESSRSMLKDLSGRLTATLLGAGVISHSETPATLLAVAYGFEHFEVAWYELLRRVAERANDQDTVEMADKILVNERQAAEKLAASYDLALERALHGAQRA